MGWHAYSPESARSKEEPDSSVQPGTVIKLMAEDYVEIPLWSVENGLLFDDEAEFVEFGGTADLAQGLSSWSAERQAEGRTDELDLKAIVLVQRLNHAFEFRYEFVYKP